MNSGTRVGNQGDLVESIHVTNLALQPKTLYPMVDLREIRGFLGKDLERVVAVA